MHTKKSNSFQAWTMWALALSFFAYQFIMRLFPGLVMSDVMIKHQVDATAFGVLSSMYYFGYAGMQIPVAVLLDRFGPRVIISLCAVLCSAATLLFVWAESWYVLLASRFLIGVGSAAGFLGTSKVISMVFSEKQYPKMVGLTFSFGLMGAIYGGKPVGLLVNQHGWEKVGLLIAIVGFFCSTLVWFFVRPNKTDSRNDKTSVLSSLQAILKNPYIVILALSNLLMVGSLDGFADVWGVPFFMKMFAFQKADAALVVSFVFFGMLFGGPLLVSLSNFLSNYYLVTAMCGLMMTLLFCLLLGNYAPFSYAALCALMFVVGIFCCYQVLVFEIGSRLVAAEDRGVTVAFLNSVNMFGGSFFHLLIGSLLDVRWQGETLGGAKVYASTDYTWALSAIPICAMIGAVLVFALRYSFKKKKLEKFELKEGILI